LLIKIVPYFQKYTPPDCFFGEFAHWAEVAVNAPHSDRSCLVHV